MYAILAVCCSTAICFGLRGWWIPMWLLLLLGTGVAACILYEESR